MAVSADWVSRGAVCLASTRSTVGEYRPGIARQCCDVYAPAGPADRFGGTALSAVAERRGPDCRRAGVCAHEHRALDYWITSFARTSNDCGRVMPSAFAVLRLITRSNLVACSMGKSSGFAP